MKLEAINQGIMDPKFKEVKPRKKPLYSESQNASSKFS